MIAKLLIATMTLTAVAFSPVSQAADPLGALALKKYCGALKDASDSAEARLCLLYINGFVDGAIVTDERVTQNVVKEVDKQESLLDRAMRTRLLGQLRDFGPSFYAEFCVGKAVSIAGIADRVMAEFDYHSALENVAAQTIVFDALRRHYPCVSKAV